MLTYEVQDGTIQAALGAKNVLVFVALQLTSQLDVAMHRRGFQDTKLAEAQLGAAALLAVQPDAFSYSSSGAKILKALAGAPIRRLTPEAMRLSQFCWCWVSGLASPERPCTALVTLLGCSDSRLRLSTCVTCILTMCWFLRAKQRGINPIWAFNFGIFCVF